ncbi:uncharacterized protein V1510DRAFT_414850 [Dipodascopsis tothii]|uniref:uncharacterized protein n=1 Tax=Dipodascopsis tothii TaxID=44089 RepID=UPI0034D00112
MDTAYDSIQRETLPDEGFVAGAAAESAGAAGKGAGKGLSDEVSEAFQTFSNSAWGVRLGGMWENVRKQGEQALDVTKKDLLEASERASKELASLGQQLKTKGAAMGAAAPAVGSAVSGAPAPSAMFALIKQRALVRIEDLEKVDFQAYLAKVGHEVGDFLKDAVTVEPDLDSDGVRARNADGVVSDVLFDLPEDIKRQIYTTRLDAQLHALHTSPEPFLTDAHDAAFDTFAGTFDIAAQTDAIAADLEYYPELRKLMERLVPEQTAYDEFWTRYYFLRDQIAQEDDRRKKLLRAAAQQEDNFDWGEDDEDEQTTPKTGATAGPRVSNSTATLAPKDDEPDKVASSRPSSEASYDLVSRTSSRADVRAAAKPAKDDDSEDEDWE